MEYVRIACALLLLCMLVGCIRPGVNSQTQTREPATAIVTDGNVPTPAETQVAVEAADPEKEAALLYQGEMVNLYLGRSEDDFGICVEELQWTRKVTWYQPLPGTEGMQKLTVTKIDPVAGETYPEAYIYVHYLDAAGEERAFCFDHCFSDFADFYPDSDELYRAVIDIFYIKEG